MLAVIVVKTLVVVEAGILVRRMVEPETLGCVDGERLRLQGVSRIVGPILKAVREKSTAGHVNPL
jgi:hypothetical protein